jgi:hypothetical protein
MHPSTFDYLKPTDEQLRRMEIVRAAAKDYYGTLDRELPVGPDRTYIMRELRSLAMWVNVAITRWPDGSPRDYYPQRIIPPR